MRVGAGLRSNEKVDCLRQGTPRRGKSLYVASASAMQTLKQRKGCAHVDWMPDVATALAFMMVGHHPVQRTGPQDRSLTPILIVQAPCLKCNQGHPAQSHGLVTTLSREPGRKEPYRIVGGQMARSVGACAGHV